MKIIILTVAFFDISTKKILLTQLMIGKPTGAGLRNYWIGAIYDILKQIDNYQYRKWVKQYCN